MTLKPLIAIFILLIQINVYAQEVSKKKENQHRNSLSNIVDNIHSYIQNNQKEKILELCSDSFLKNKNHSELKTIIKNINSILTENNLKSINSFRESQSLYTQLVNNELSSKNTFKYTYTPPLFGKETADLFSNFIGYKVELEFVKQNFLWKLNNISCTHNYYNKEYDMLNYVSDFMSSKKDVNIQFSVHKNNNQITGNTKDNLSKVSLNLENVYLKYIDYKSIIKAGSEDKYSLSFSCAKEKEEEPKDIFSYIFAPKKEYLELAFYDSDAKLIMITDGKKYAFYKTNKINEIKNYILSQLPKTE